VKPLLEAVENVETVALSRLTDPMIRRALEDGGHTVFEVPHIGCNPVSVMVPADTMRIRSWPNLGGVLESGTAADLVAWWPSLAEEPHTGQVVQLDTETPWKIWERTRFLCDLLKSLEQIRGVAAACTPQAPRAILYSSGVPSHDLHSFQARFHGSLEVVPDRLAEFPGGLCATVSPKAWLQKDAYAEALEELLRRHTR